MEIAGVLAFGSQNNQPLGPVLEAIVRPSKPQKLLPVRGQVRPVRRKPKRTLVGRGKLYQPHFSLISLLWLMTQQTWSPHPRSSVSPTAKHQDLGHVLSTGQPAWPYSAGVTTSSSTWKKLHSQEERKEQ